MARRVSSVIAYTIASFFVYGAELTAFISEDPIAGKFIVTGVLFVLGALALLCGLALRQFANPARDVGIVFLSASGFMAFGVFTIFCYSFSPEFKEVFPEDKLDSFSDYATGFSCIAVFGVIGLVLLWKANRKLLPDEETDAVVQK